LELLDHEARDWSKGDLSRGRLIGSKKFLKLWKRSALDIVILGLTYRLLSEIIRKICNHDLVL
jgi:hypothetical protein